VKGAFVVGCSSQSLFWGDYFANTTDVIFVSFNYRLSALGFLYTGNDITGMQRLVINQKNSHCIVRRTSQ